jgi:hypothetical protein
MPARNLIRVIFHDTWGLLYFIFGSVNLPMSIAYFSMDNDVSIGGLSLEKVSLDSGVASLV